MGEETLILAVKPILRSGEGPIPHFYLDHLGHLTIGIGHLVHSQGDSRPLGPVVARLASKYHFYSEGVPPIWTPPGAASAVTSSWHILGHSFGSQLVESWCGSRPLPLCRSIRGLFDGPRTLVGDLTAEAEAVSALPFGKKRPASAFASHTHFRLSKTDMERLFEADITEKIRQLRSDSHFLGFQSYPLSAKVAILDLAFNLGVGRLRAAPKKRGAVDNFPGREKFLEAVGKRDWATASTWCARGNVQPDRNSRTRKLFEAAALGERQSEPLNSRRRLDLINQGGK